MRVFFATLFMISACGCPVSSDDTDTAASWTAQRDAVCASVDGCDAAYLASLPVYELAPADVADICTDNAAGCFCASPFCAGAIIVTDRDVPIPNCDPLQPCMLTQREQILHEYTHAVYHAQNTDTHEHPSFFNDAMHRARALLREQGK